MDPREQLLQNNPFTSGCASDPWSERYPCVDSINGDVLEHVTRLIRQKISDPTTGLAALVLGDAGMGKTFFLKRILQKLHGGELRA
ncbi:MAG: hypothetical protein Q4C47_08730, partial [Planctomycetia bacterium]|nr:hypothetical protein [Planctomycetia bacterium]